MQVGLNKKRLRSLTRFYQNECFKALEKTIAPILAVEQQPEVLKRIKLKDDYMEAVLNTLYLEVGKEFAVSTAKTIRSKKDDFYDDYFRRYAADRSKKIAGTIVTTVEQNINLTIDRVTERLTREGAAINDIAKLLQQELSRELVDIQTWEAIRISQTEVIGTANLGSFRGARDSQIPGMRKGWLTSGRPGIRTAHLMHEAHGFVEMDFDYGQDSGASGLQFPGDTNCTDASEVVNCRCTIIYQFE